MKGREASSYTLTCVCVQACTLLCHARGRLSKRNLSSSPQFLLSFGCGNPVTTLPYIERPVFFARARAPTPPFELKALGPDLSSPVLSFVSHILYILYSPPLIGSHSRQEPSDDHVPFPESKTNLGNRRVRPKETSKRSLPSLPSVPLSILGLFQHLRLVTTLTITGSPHPQPCSGQQTMNHLGHHSYYHWALLPNAYSRTPRFWKHNEKI
jgi:hypothetical protein